MLIVEARVNALKQESCLQSISYAMLKGVVIVRNLLILNNIVFSMRLPNKADY